MEYSAAAIICAAGYGTRMKRDQPKQYLELAGSPMLVHTVRAFLHHPAIDRTIVAAPEELLTQTRTLLQQYGLDDISLTLTAGGKRRQDSVLAGLMLLDDDTDIVLVHDGARPLIGSALISRCCEKAAEHGAAIAAVPVKDTLKRKAENNRVSETINRDGLWQAQTPQASQVSLLRQAYDKAAGADVTDESMLLELAGIPVTLVEGEETNIKITRPEDLLLAETIMRQQRQPSFRIGHGYDAHRLVADRRLVLGGVSIPYERGLAGHSDADVVTHAICDALLGAMGLGDIGRHFPDSDGAYKDIYSIHLLEKVIRQMADTGYSVHNIDITVVCQAPKLAPYLEAMKKILATACETSETAINIKATTTEHMGFAGRGEGISCHAVALLTTHEPVGDDNDYRNQ